MDETRRLLKTFGVAVTEFESEAKRIVNNVQGLADSSSSKDILRVLKDVAELCGELNARWLEINQRIHDLQRQLFSTCATVATDRGVSE